MPPWSMQVRDQYGGTSFAAPQRGSFLAMSITVSGERKGHSGLKVIPRLKPRIGSSYSVITRHHQRQQPARAGEGADSRRPGYDW